MLLKDYSISLLKTIPAELYAGIICIAVLGILVSAWAYGIKKSIQISSLVGFVVYGIYIICTTVVFRPARDESRVLNLKPFWSYSAINSGDTRLIDENLMNVFVFIPIGLLLAVGIKKSRWWHIALIGCMVSVIVEFLQFYYKRGLCEFDDLLHNTIGCLIGFLMIKGLVLLYYNVKNIRKQYDEVR